MSKEKQTCVPAERLSNGDKFLKDHYLAIETRLSMDSTPPYLVEDNERLVLLH